MHTTVRPDLYAQLYNLCQTGGMVVDGTTQFTCAEQGRIHQVYRVQTRNKKYILQCLNLVVINNPLALEKLINTVLAPALMTPHLLRWPATDRCVLNTDTGHWILRPYIVGKTLTTQLSIPSFEAMASTLRHFHRTLKIAEFEQAKFTGVNPWSGEATHALENRLNIGTKMNSREREIIRQSKRFKQTLVEADTNSHYSDVVVHRDAKPSNFIQKPNNSLVLIDFDTIGIGDPALDLGEILRAWLSSDELTAKIDLPDTSLINAKRHIGQSDPWLAINRADCTLALQALETGYNDPEMTTPRIRKAAMQCCLWQCERFLEDHFAGNSYYKVHTHGDNMHRAEQQLVALGLLSETTTA